MVSSIDTLIHPLKKIKIIMNDTILKKIPFEIFKIFETVKTY